LGGKKTYKQNKLKEKVRATKRQIAVGDKQKNKSITIREQEEVPECFLKTGVDCGTGSLDAGYRFKFNSGWRLDRCHRMLRRTVKEDNFRQKERFGRIRSRKVQQNQGKGEEVYRARGKRKQQSASGSEKTRGIGSPDTEANGPGPMIDMTVPAKKGIR